MIFPIRSSTSPPPSFPPLIHQKLSNRVLGATFTVHNALGPGLLESAYEGALVVEGTIILELKSAKALSAAMDAQIINYLKLSGLPVGYLLNFYGTRVEWRRFVNCGQLP